MIRDLWLIGIGTGSLGHLTVDGLNAIRNAGAILIPHKGEEKGDLAELRYQLIASTNTTAELIPFEYPTRDPDLPYLERVNAWHDEIAQRWVKALDGKATRNPVALLVWGDPSLYDSTLRIAERLNPRPNIRVLPGITAIQALTAAHAIPLNDINGPILVTTGRRLRDEGWPDGTDTLVVMLDGECSFESLEPDGLHIWWGAYLGGPNQILQAGPLGETSPKIIAARADARAEHGWIMDTYLLRRNPSR